MVLSNVNILEAMESPRLDAKTEKETRAMMEKIMRDTYVLAGLEPQLVYEQLDDLTHDLRAGHPHLTFEEVRLTCKAGVSGELGGPKRPSYAAVMQWCEAYDRSAMTADCRKIRKNRTAEPKRITVEEGWKIFCENMPLALDRRWEDVRTLGKFGNATVPHVSAQIYDWLGEEGVLHLTDKQKREATDKGTAEVKNSSVWDMSHLESGKALIRSRVKHYALEIWMQDLYRSGQKLPDIPKISRLYD